VPVAATNGEFRVERQPSVSNRRSLPWLGLACILIVYVITVVRLHPTNFFGQIGDDTIYFSSAKAIAEGRGYILPSIPGAPAAAKYPVLYPWILSWIWRWNPSFPANLVDAIALSVSFAMVFLTVVFVFLRRLGGVNDQEALVITAFCALHPALLFYGSNILTDIPFAALALGAMMVADRSMRPGASLKFALLCGILAGLATEMRSIGIAVVAGIAAAALLRRAWRQVWMFAASAGAFFIPAIWRAFFSAARTPEFAASVAANFGWNKAWVFYTSYLGFWRISIPDTRVLLTMLERNAIWLLRAPSDYFLLPSLARGGVAGLVLLLVVTGFVVAGVVRQARGHGWKPIHWILLFYMGIVLVWNFNDPYRFLLPFVPLFVGGYWLETKRILGQTKQVLAERRSIGEVILAGSFVVVIVAGNAAIVWNHTWGGRQMVSEASARRADLLPGKLEAYAWISRSTRPDSRILAYEDSSLYLYTGRQAMAPIRFTTVEFIEPERMQVALDHMTDVARAIGAEYWLASNDDFHLESSAVSQAAMRREDDIERDLPLVFRSADGRVRIYGLGCMQLPEEIGCKTRNRSSGF
jgi:4-amino-4-deoxy-L-arabinose transferase-like glycosyltransferase